MKAQGLRDELDRLVEACDVAARVLPDTHPIAWRLFDVRGIVQNMIDRVRAGEPWPKDPRLL